MAIKQLRFTGLLMITLVLASWLGHNRVGQLDPQVAEQVSHAPRHFGSGELVRLVTSIPFTSDYTHLAIALVMTLVCVGLCERLKGTMRTSLIFLGCHAATLAILALALTVGHFLLGSKTTGQLLNIADVGPSAGYYGCLGASLIALDHAYVRHVRWAVIVFLIVRLVISSTTLHVFQTDLAHLIAFVLGLQVARRRVTVELAPAGA